MINFRALTTFLFGKNPYTSVTNKDMITLRNASPKKYVFRLTQSGSDDPVALVFNNDFPTLPVWARTGTGEYTCTLKGAWDNNGLEFLGGRCRLLEPNSGAVIMCSFVDNDTLLFQTYDGIGGSLADGLLDPTADACCNTVVVWPVQ